MVFPSERKNNENLEFWYSFYFFLFTLTFEINLCFSFVINYDLLSIKGERKFKISWFPSALEWRIFERENLSGTQTPQCRVSVNLKKIWAVERNFVFYAVRIFDFEISIFEGVNHYAVAIAGWDISQICDNCMASR